MTSGGPGNHYIRCMVCNAATDDTWKAEAIAAWTRRAALKPSGDAGEMVERLLDGVRFCGMHDDNDTELFDIEGANDAMAEAAALITTLVAENERLAAAMGKIDAIRNSIIQ